MTLAKPSCLFTYSVGASCSHAAVMCWIVSDSFPHLLHSSSVSGCFKIYFLQFLVSMTWSCIAVRKPSVSANKSALSAICSTLLCLHIVGWGHTGGGRARIFGTIVSWLCYYILHLWRVHLHSRGQSPVVRTYHLLLLLQHEEKTWPVCLRSMSEGASPVFVQSSYISQSSATHLPW